MSRLFLVLPPFIALASVLVAQPNPGPVRMVFVVHIDPAPFHMRATWDKGRFVLDNLAKVFEQHKGRLIIASSWNFIRGCQTFGNGPSYPGSLGDLAQRGHEIAYHDHGGVSLQTAVQAIRSLTSLYTNQIYPRHIEGSGPTTLLASLGIQSSSGNKEVATQLVDAAMVPYRRARTNEYRRDPRSPILRLTAGPHDPAGFAPQQTAQMTAALLYAIANRDPRKPAFVHVGLTHPDEYLRRTQAQILKDMQALNGWLTKDVDPLVAQGKVQWANAGEMVQAFKAWEQAGGSNADLFPPVNVTDPAWSYFTTTNSGLLSTFVQDVFWSTAGTLFCGTAGAGVAFYDGKNWGSWTPSNSPLRAANVHAFAEGPAGTVWLLGFATPGTGGGPALYRVQGSTWTTFDRQTSPLQGNFFFDVAVDSLGILWVGTNRGLFRYDGRSWTVYTTANSGLPAAEVWRVVPEAGDVVFTCHRAGGLTRFEHRGPGAPKWTHFTTANGLPANTVYDFVFHPSGKMYVATRLGLAEYNGRTFRPITRANSELVYDQVVDLLVDRFGDVWCATYGKGVARYRPSIGRFETYDVAGGELAGFYATGLAEAPDGRIFVAFRHGGGVSVYTPPALHAVGRPELGKPTGLTLHLPKDPGLPYVVAAAFGTQPAIPLPPPDTRKIPLRWDPLFVASLLGQVPSFQGFQGRLDATGAATPVVQVPPFPSLRGVQVAFAAVTLDAQAPSGIRSIAGPLVLTIR